MAQKNEHDYEQWAIYLQFALFVLLIIVTIYDFFSMFGTFLSGHVVLGLILGILFIFLCSCAVAMGVSYRKRKTFAIDEDKILAAKIKQLKQQRAAIEKGQTNQQKGQVSHEKVPRK